MNGEATKSPLPAFSRGEGEATLSGAEGEGSDFIEVLPPLALNGVRIFGMVHHTSSSSSAFASFKSSVSKPSVNQS
jgi:hypothetical protein